MDFTIFTVEICAVQSNDFYSSCYFHWHKSVCFWARLKIHSVYDNYLVLTQHRVSKWGPCQSDSDPLLYKPTSPVQHRLPELMLLLEQKLTVPVFNALDSMHFNNVSTEQLLTWHSSMPFAILIAQSSATACLSVPLNKITLTV